MKTPALRVREDGTLCMDRWKVFETLNSDSRELNVRSLTSSTSPTNVINTQIRLLVEDNQQLRDKIRKTLLINITMKD